MNEEDCADNFSARRWVLEQEISLVFHKINHFDDLRHRTMQLAVTLTIAVVGGAFSIRSTPLLFIAALVPIPFWVIDARYHSYQEGYTLRWISIERFLSGRWGPEDFPIPDYYGRRTHREHASKTSLMVNLLSARSIVTYLGLAVFVFCLASSFWLYGFPARAD